MLSTSADFRNSRVSFTGNLNAVTPDDWTEWITPSGLHVKFSGTVVEVEVLNPAGDRDCDSPRALGQYRAEVERLLLTASLLTNQPLIIEWEQFVVVILADGSRLNQSDTFLREWPVWAPVPMDDIALIAGHLTEEEVEVLDYLSRAAAMGRDERVTPCCAYLRFVTEQIARSEKRHCGRGGRNEVLQTMLGEGENANVVNMSIELGRHDLASDSVKGLTAKRRHDPLSPERLLIIMRAVVLRWLVHSHSNLDQIASASIEAQPTVVYTEAASFGEGYSSANIEAFRQASGF